VENLRPLVLTVQVEKNAQAYLENLRKQHFPPEVNYISARLSVFHALPRTMIEQVDSVLTTRTAQHRLIESQVTGVKSLGRGVAFVIPCGELEAPAGRTSGGVERRSDAGGSEQVETSRHDPEQGDSRSRESFAGHVGVEVRTRHITVRGLDLWHYNGGPWELARSYQFTGSQD
jgi:hypothetical protein